MKRTINVHDAKTHFSRLLDAAEAGEEIVIAKAGRPCARLGPITVSRQRTLGFVEGVVDDSFFEPLDDRELAAWE